MDPACAFCRIAAGATPAAVVFQDGFCLAFLDARPLFPGHCLLIPREHYETMADLPADAAGPLFITARRLCMAVEDAMESEGTFVAVNNRVSQSVPHLHVHVVPRRRKDGLRGFFWPRMHYADEDQVESVRSRIAEALERR